MLNLFNLITSSKSKDDLKEFFNESKEHQLHIQVESVTEYFKELVEEKIINLTNKIKSFSEKYDPKNTQ